MMNPVYRQAQFTTSAHTLGQLPEDVVAEVAFAGRSNAGKSSAINTLTGNGKLARTSRTPGRTQLINHFVLKEGRYLVDLPGYGYAKVSQSQRQHWAHTLGEYLRRRESLRCLVIVMDIRHPLQKADWQMIELQQYGDSDLHLLLTKADKIGKSKSQLVLMDTMKQLSDAGVEATLQTFSATTGGGIDDLQQVLDENLFSGTGAG